MPVMIAVDRCTHHVMSLEKRVRIGDPSAFQQVADAGRRHGCTFEFYKAVTVGGEPVSLPETGDVEGRAGTIGPEREVLPHVDRDRPDNRSQHVERERLVGVAREIPCELEGDDEVWLGGHKRADSVIVGAEMLRIAAGKHYPTDVVVGALVGSGISLAVIQIHKKRNNRFSLWAYPGGAGLTIRI